MIVKIRFGALAMSVLNALILTNYFGQRIIDKKNEVFYSAYFCSGWYLMTPELRRHIHIILNCSTDCSGLTARKMGEISLEAAGIVIIIRL